jgi:hypothetical protein
MSHLTDVGQVRDEKGMASTALAEAVGYPGSSIAFAQLLSGMERSGLIEREVRGKRTYLIAPAGTAASKPAARRHSRSRRRAAASGPRVSPPASLAGRGGNDFRADEVADPGPAGATKRAGEFDYDELARRLLIQVVRRLAAAPGQGPAAAPAAAEAAPAFPAQATRPLEETVASLEQKLASVQTRQRTLAEENAKLREQLHEAQRSLALVQEHTRPRIAEQLNSAEGVILERLLSLAADRRERGGEAETG